MVVTGDNTYGGQVYAEPYPGREEPALLRALHAELCRRHPHGDGSFPACVRALSVVRRWEDDGRPA